MHVDHDDFHLEASFVIVLAIIAIAVTFLAYTIQ